jgi:hypothetical protein
MPDAISTVGGSVPQNPYALKSKVKSEKDMNEIIVQNAAMIEQPHAIVQTTHKAPVQAAPPVTNEKDNKPDGTGNGVVGQGTSDRTSGTSQQTAQQTTRKRNSVNTFA